MTIDLDSDMLFTCHPDPLWIYDRDSLRFLAVNNAAIAKYGYSREEFLAMTIADIRPQEDMPQLLANVASVTTGLDHAGVWTHRLKSGDTIFVDITSHAVDYQGLKAELVSARDVTKLIKNNERLQQQEANLRTTQRLLSLGTWEQNLDTGELTWSDNVYAMYGVDPKDFASGQKTFRALLHPDDREEMFARIAAYEAAPKSHFNFQHRIVRPDGNIIHVRGVGELTTTKAGRVLSGVLRDVTAEVEASAQLAAAASIQRIAGRAARLGGWRVDIASESVEWSEETAAIHEVTADSQGKYHLSLNDAIGFFAPEHRQELWQLFFACKTLGKSFDQAFQLITAKGNCIWGRVIGEPEYDDNGNICALRGALQNITEQIEAQKKSDDLSTRLHQTLDSMSDAFFVLDRDYRFVYLNDRAAQLMQQDKGDLAGQLIADRFDAANLAPFIEQYRKAASSGTAVHFTTYSPALKTWFSVNAHPSDEGLAVYFRDVTEAKIRDEQLRLLETAVSRQNDILVITEANTIDAPDGPKIVYINDAFVRKTGFSREEVLGKTPRILQGKDTQRSELDRIRNALATVEPVRSELINYTKSGEPFWLELDIVPLANGSGKPSHFVAVQRDISERKAAEQTAKINEERFQLVARATNDVIWDWDLVNNRVWWNEALKTIFGYAPDDMEAGADSWSNRIHLDDKERVLDSIHQVIAGNDSKWQHEYRFIHADDKAVAVIDRGFVIRDTNGKAVRMVGSMQDITERLEMADRLRHSQKMEAMGQLTGGVAHDFNNLLTVILGNAELLAEQLTGQQQLRLLAEMTATAAERGAELTNRLLAFARRQALEPRLLDINRLVCDMETMLRRTLKENIDIEMVRAGGLWIAEVDPGQLESALLNLAINARDAMPEGGRLTIETANTMLDDDYASRHQEVNPGQYVMMSVSDTGVGMAADTMTQAFDPFFTTKQVGKGSGLGLSMVYGFVKQSGGHAKIYSEPGEGTTVKLYFPRANASGEMIPGSAMEPMIAGGSEHILVVEDDDLVRDHVIALLKGLGYEVTSASSGAEALQILSDTHSIDLLFTDVIMTGINGRQLADKAQQLRPGLKTLFTSGYTENAIVHHGRLDPGVQLLSKPYRRQELAIKLRKLLDNGADT